MRETISVKNNQSQKGLNFFQGNIAVIAVSSAAKSFGAGLVSTYVSLYFVELGGSPITLGLMTAMTYVIGCAMFPLGGFIADYYGRRRILVLTAFYSVFFPLFYAVIQHACNFQDIKHWLIKNIHSYGDIYDPSDLLKKTSGKELSVKPYLSYLNEKYSKLYGF